MQDTISSADDFSKIRVITDGDAGKIEHGTVLGWDLFSPDTSTSWSSSNRGTYGTLKNYQEEADKLCPTEHMEVLLWLCWNPDGEGNNQKFEDLSFVFQVDTSDGPKTGRISGRSFLQCENPQSGPQVPRNSPSIRGSIPHAVLPGFKTDKLKVTKVHIHPVLTNPKNEGVGKNKLRLLRTAVRLPCGSSQSSNLGRPTVFAENDIEMDQIHGTSVNFAPRPSTLLATTVEKTKKPLTFAQPPPVPLRCPEGVDPDTSDSPSFQVVYTPAWDNGKYFAFYVADAERIIKRTLAIEGELLPVRNSRTNTTRAVRTWSVGFRFANESDAKGDAHGRWHPIGKRAVGDWEVNDTITILLSSLVVNVNEQDDGGKYFSFRRHHLDHILGWHFQHRQEITAENVRTGKTAKIVLFNHDTDPSKGRGRWVKNPIKADWQTGDILTVLV